MTARFKEQHGFYPGTFDPIHSGHLEIAKNASESVDKVWVLPNPVRPKSKPNTTDIDTRRELVKISIAEDPHLSMPEDEAWNVYSKSYHDYGVDEAITALSTHLDVDPVHIVGQDVYEKRDHSGRKVMLVPRGNDNLIERPDVLILPAVGQVSSSEIRERLSRGEFVKEIPSVVYQEIKRRGLYEGIPLSAESQLVKKWILERITEWQAALHF